MFKFKIFRCMQVCLFINLKKMYVYDIYVLKSIGIE